MQGLGGGGGRGLELRSSVLGIEGLGSRLTQQDYGPPSPLIREFPKIGDPNIVP